MKEIKFMKVVLKILGGICIFIGILVVLIGVADSGAQYPSPVETAPQPMSQVIGGGLFMALGIAIFILAKEN